MKLANLLLVVATPVLLSLAACGGAEDAPVPSAGAERGLTRPSCEDPEPCAGGAHRDPRTCTCVQDQCRVGSCTGAIPRLCMVCQETHAVACAHWACVEDRCEIEVCPRSASR